jgi:hypothetical protein
VSVLTDATPESFAEGILSVIDDRARGREIGGRARELADTKYSYDAYLACTRQALAHLDVRAAPEIAGGVA